MAKVCDDHPRCETSVNGQEASGPFSDPLQSQKRATTKRPVSPFKRRCNRSAKRRFESRRASSSSRASPFQASGPFSDPPLPGQTTTRRPIRTSVQERLCNMRPQGYPGCGPKVNYVPQLTQFKLLLRDQLISNLIRHVGLSPGISNVSSLLGVTFGVQEIRATKRCGHVSHLSEWNRGRRSYLSQWDRGDRGRCSKVSQCRRCLIKKETCRCTRQSAEDRSGRKLAAGLRKQCCETAAAATRGGRAEDCRVSGQMFTETDPTRW